MMVLAKRLVSSDDKLYTQVVETSVTNNSFYQNYPHLDGHTIRTTDTPGFKPFAIENNVVTDLNLAPRHVLVPGHLSVYNKS